MMFSIFMSHKASSSSACQIKHVKTILLSTLSQADFEHQFAWYISAFKSTFFPSLLTLIQTDALAYCLRHVSRGKFHIVEVKWKCLTSGLKTSASKGLFFYDFFEELLSTDLFPPKCKKAQFIQGLFCEKKEFSLEKQYLKRSGVTNMSWCYLPTLHLPRTKMGFK